MRRFAFSVTVFSLSYLMLITQTYGQTSPSDPVAALRQQLIGGDGAATLQIDGIHATTKAIGRPVDNRVSNGAVQSRGALELLRGTGDTVLHIGEQVRVTSVDIGSDSKSDILRITTLTRNNSLALIALVVPKGFLRSMSLTQLEQLVTPVIRSANAVEPPLSSSTISRPVATLRPAPPPYPARDVIDLPPAAPGYPSLHASAPAMEGCWWTPFLSEKYSLEMLVQRCAPGSGFGGENDTFVETASGIGVHAGSNPEIENILQVLNKPADQSLPLAIRQQFISKEKDAAVRANCVAKLQSKSTEPAETYSIVPTGAYSRLKKFNKGVDSEDPCPGLGSDDNVGRSFIYIPAESKTKFIFYESQDAWPFDLASVHFLATGEPTSNNPSASGTTTLSSAPEPTGGTPQRGRWINVGKLYPHDLSGDAATAGTFNLNLQNNLQPATLFVSCDGRIATSPKLIMRIAVPRYPGAQAYKEGDTGTLFIGSQKREAPFESSASVNLVFIEVVLSPAEIKELAFEDEVEVGGLSFSFLPTFVRAVITADLPPASATLDSAIKSCHIQLPPRPSPPVSEVSAERVYQLELAKISLGMTAEEARVALGANFQFFPQTDPRFPQLSYLAAVSTNAAYALTLIDGKVQGFNYFQGFPEGAQPLQANLIAGVTAKSWQPLFVRPPYRALWVADERGKPVTKPLPDIVISPCEGTGAVSFGPINQRGDSTPARNLYRILPRDNGPSCGVTITMSMTPSHNNNEAAASLSLSVANDEVFHSFMQGVRQLQQEKQMEQRKKADEVKNPF